ncbi:hypothetical protein MRX96_004819 [Rhipicephalus microplus]
MMVMLRKRRELSPTVQKIMDGLLAHAKGNFITPVDTSACFEGMSRGKMVAFSTCHEDEVSSAAKWNLVPAKQLVMIYQVPAMHVLNPKRLYAFYLKNAYLPPEVSRLFGGLEPSWGHKKRICKMLKERLGDW